MSQTKLGGPMRFARATLPAFFAALLCAGCGGGTGDVSGKVTYKGKPVVGGSVTILDSQGGFHQETVGQDGTYTIKKVPTGPARVAVVYSDPKMTEDLKKRAEWGRKPENLGKPQPPFDDSKYVKLPNQYGNVDKSGLTTTIERKPDNKFDITLQ